MTRHLLAVVRCVRNEGQFLLEWVAWQQVLGFQRVFLLTNDCDDGTDLIADRLEQLGDVIHIRNEVGEGESPQVVGMRLVLSDPRLADVEWLLHCDVDGFLDVSVSNGQVRDLIEAVSPADVVAICWRHMGSDGMIDWQGGSVVGQFKRSSKIPRRDAERHKCMFRPERFRRAIDHMPKADDIDGLILKDAAENRINPISMAHPTHSQFRRNRDIPLTWENAVLDHYAAKSQDVFLMKNFRGTGMREVANKYVLHSTSWMRADRNRVKHDAPARRLPELSSRVDKYLQDTKLRELNAQAAQWFQDRKKLLTDDLRSEWSALQTQNEQLDDASSHISKE